MKHSALLLLIILASLPGGAQTPSPTAAPNVVSGWMLREGHTFEINMQSVTIKGVHCREADLADVAIELEVAPRKPGDPPTADPVLRISGDVGRVKLNQILTPETQLDVETGGNRNRSTRILGWASRVLRGASATLPRLAWVQFKALSKNGPVDVKFSADFGDMGSVKGHVYLSNTEEITCRVPGR